MRNSGLERPGFLVIGLAIFLALAASCRSPSSPVPGEEMNFTSSTDQSHTHIVILFRSDLETPPASGISTETAISDGHFHRMAMTRQELVAVNNGTTVTVVTTVVSGHSHTFTIFKWF